MKTGITTRRNHVTTTETPVDNGVNVEALLGVRDALSDTPDIAKFQWRSTVSWVNGTHSRSRDAVSVFLGRQNRRGVMKVFSYPLIKKPASNERFRVDT